MRENLAVYNFSLNRREMKAIDAMGFDAEFRRRFVFFDWIGGEL